MKIKQTLVFCFGIALVLMTVGNATAAEITVHPGESIQAAVNAANPGDTIRVYPGTYSENVDVDKQLTIISTDGASVTSVIAASAGDHVFEVTADGVTIIGFTIMDATGNSGIYLYEVEGCNITENILSNNNVGIYLYSSSNNTLTSNTAESKSGSGIYLSSSSNNTLMNNTAANNAYGIFLHCSSNNTLNNNSMLNNREGLYLWSLSNNNVLSNNNMSGNDYNFIGEGVNDVDTSNTVDGKPIYYLVNISDITLDSTSNAGTVYCINCYKICIRDLTVENNGYGIYLYNTTNSKIDNITVSHTYHGIRLFYSSNNTLMNNTAANNTPYGITLHYSDNNTLTNNNASNDPSNDPSYNSRGIWLHSSSDNILTNNTVVDNWYGIYLGSSSDNTLTDNNASNNGNGIWMDSSSNNILTNNVALNNDYSIYLISSSGNTLTNNNASNNIFGIRLISSSDNNILISNTASNNAVSIRLDDSTNNKMTNNNASDNGGGILLSRSSNNLIYNNIASENVDYGIYLYSSSNNLIYNNIFNNSRNVLIAGTNTGNIWNITNSSGPNIMDGPYLGGNFWATPDATGHSQICTDINNDGFCDSPYIISGNNVDYLPLTYPPNQPPAITSLTVQPTEPIEVGTEVDLTATFTDSDSETHTATIDWGDGSTDTVDPVEGYSISVSHPYVTAGVYTITLKVTDDDGGLDTMTSEQYVVVYDPDGGFVTGSGWIYSPSGAYTPDNPDDEDLIGKAIFGFVSKYKNGATVPTGTTEFEFKVADLNFHSDDYQWLVIAGSKPQYKGSGTINDEGNYGFMLTAIDAELTPSTDVDLFRIKIWDKDNNDAVVYDNMLGADEGENPTTAIQGGAIKVHTKK